MEKFSKRYKALFAEAMDAMKATMAEKSNLEFGVYKHIVDFSKVDGFVDMPYDGIAIYGNDLVWVDLTKDGDHTIGVETSFDISSMEILPCEFLNIVDAYIGE